MKRKISVPLAVAETIKWLPKATVVRTLGLFPIALTVIPILPSKGWVEVTLEGAGSLSRHTDYQLRNLLMLTYLVNPPEFCYRNLVASKYLDASVEVLTEVGRVDVVTPLYVIEVKVARSWKHALGQSLAYAWVTGKHPVVALFGDIPNCARDLFLVYGVDIIEM